MAHRNAYGRPEVIANREGQNITPSVIYFGTDPPAVGQEAKEWARLGNAEIASFFKPHMGIPCSSSSFTAGRTRRPTSRRWCSRGSRKTPRPRSGKPSIAP